jgi:ADP-heptose:LPS heptosyltransferase/glycosyltransferase involved in cell wall biosynthesis
VFIVDTGSTDDTVEVAAQWGAHVRTYTDASVQDETGEWKLQDFSKARNEVIADAEAWGADWYMWMDADDELLAPEVVRRLLYWPQYDCFGARVHDHAGGDSWVHHRLWKMEKRVRFAGRVHEYAVLDGLSCMVIEQFKIRHDATPGSGENANARNLRILQTDFAENPTTRGAFYLAGTHRDGGRNELAAQWFHKRIEMGEGYRDEWLFAHLYAARAHRALEEWAQADEMAARGAYLAPDWAEFRMERAFIAYKRGSYAEAIERATGICGMPMPATQLWREPPMYRDQPLRLISWCHEHLGNMSLALTYAQEAKRHIIGDDLDWDARIARLESQQPHGVAKMHEIPAAIRDRNTRPIIGLCRPGAIGDILMTLNLIPALREANPGHDIAYFCDRRLGQPEALGALMHAAGVDIIMDCAGWDRWRNSYDRQITLTGYPLQEGYPDKPMARHLLRYFAAEMGLNISAIGPDDNQTGLPALTLRRPERRELPHHADYVSLQWSAGWSKYKQWSKDSWMEVIGALTDDGIPVLLIDESCGRTLAQSVAAFANARVHMGIDSFCNHLTHYMWEYPGGGRKVRGVILWGSTQASAAGYSSNINISRALPCQPCFKENPAISRMDRGPCINPPRATYDDETPHACMADITVDEVVDAVRQLWKESE